MRINRNNKNLKYNTKNYNKSECIQLNANRFVLNGV